MYKFKYGHEQNYNVEKKKSIVDRLILYLDLSSLTHQFISTNTLRHFHIP